MTHCRPREDGAERDLKMLANWSEAGGGKGWINSSWILWGREHCTANALISAHDTDFGFLASRAVRVHIFVVLSHEVCGFVMTATGKRIHIPYKPRI